MPIIPKVWCCLFGYSNSSHKKISNILEPAWRFRIIQSSFKQSMNMVSIPMYGIFICYVPETSTIHVGICRIVPWIPMRCMIYINLTLPQAGRCCLCMKNPWIGRVVEGGKLSSHPKLKRGSTASRCFILSIHVWFKKNMVSCHHVFFGNLGNTPMNWVINTYSE